METNKSVVESEVQMYEQKVCQICKDASCWGEATHEQPYEKKVQEKPEDFTKIIKAATENQA